MFFFRHHRSEQASAQTAEAEFQTLRNRFADQRPLLDMRERRPLADVSQSRTGAPLHWFHTVIFDTRGGQRIVRITVPYRFGRLFAGRDGFRWLGESTFLDDTEFDPEPIQLLVDQIERHGPGLIADYRPHERRPVHRLGGIIRIRLPLSRQQPLPIVGVILNSGRGGERYGLWVLKKLFPAKFARILLPEGPDLVACLARRSSALPCTRSFNIQLA